MNNLFKFISIILPLSATLLVTGCGLETQEVQPLSPAQQGTIEKDIISCNVTSSGLETQGVQPLSPAQQGTIEKDITSCNVTGNGLETQGVQPLSPAKLGTIEKDVTYCDVDGLHLKMDIYYPKFVSGLVPAVLYLHGGSFIMGDKSETFDVNELLTRGYLVASINYRLAPQYKFPAQIEDAKCAIRYLRGNAGRLGLDTAHIGVLGYSAGAVLAALLGVTDSSDGFDGSGGWIDQSNRVQAVVDVAGPSNWVLLNDDSYRNNLDQLFGASNYDSEKLYWASPIKYVSKNSAPFLIAHGDKDDVVPLEQSQILYNRLNSCDVPVTFIIAKNVTHNWGPAMPNARANFEEINNFFDKYLK